MTNARRMFYLLFVPMCFVVFAYPPARLAAWHGPESALGVGWIALIWAVAVAALLYSFAGPKMRVRYVTVHWMGASFILLALVAAYEVARLIAPPTALLSDRTAAVWIVIIAAALVALAVAASHFLGVKHLRFHSDKVTRAHRIVQISDVHIGSRQGGYLARIVKRINRLSPHLVVITGDLVDSSAVGHDELRCLSGLRARALFTTGNHERYADLDKVLELLGRLGVEPLRQRRVLAGELEVIGIDDADEHDQVADKLPAIECGRDRYTVLLYHRPLGWEAAVAHGVDLMLCGHTHNGQIFPFNWLVKRQFNRIRGLYRAGEARLYVSPGTGTWGPLMRLGSLNEITCIDVRPSSSPSDDAR
ncbi:MAG: metallophosphoesterase [bacterium]